MIAFAGNSILCRLALEHTEIDAASFTLIRIASGALILMLLAYKLRDSKVRNNGGNWFSAFALFAYAAGFSFAYISLPAATGALLLFGAVQVTMISYGIWKGERLHILQQAGFVLAFIGLVGLLLPGISTPSVSGSILMLCAGFAWGVYSLHGRSATDPTSVTAGNFLRAVPVTLLLSLLTLNNFVFDNSGFWYAVASGAIASGLGYAVWYKVLPRLTATYAASVQLSVPVIAALGGVIILDEMISLRLIFSAIAILGGIALVVINKQNKCVQRSKQVYRSTDAKE